ncbi:hypothetical protein [Cytobacillus gottheilii]|uniref:hypothetical protein n=1 Tax=Cytobacillus gottheilii TaxID=859144 RepID=UPI0009BC62C2|nr:hypothetical protein [Cytobacillus gottheilii]
MKPAINEDKRVVLLEHIDDIESEIYKLVGDLENDPEVSEELWKKIDQQDKVINKKIRKLKDEVYYT